MLIGNVLSNADGVILAIDEAVAVLLERRQCELAGLSYVEITYPSDRRRNAAFVDSLDPTHGPKSIRKTYITGTGGKVLVDLQTTCIGLRRDTSYLHSTVTTADPKVAPRKLWRQARYLSKLASARDCAIGNDIFADAAWQLMLNLYIAEAEGRLAGPRSLADSTGLSIDALTRWANALSSRGMIEAHVADATYYQFTSEGLDTLERLLALAPSDSA